MGYWSAHHHLPTWPKSHRARAARLSSILYVPGMTVGSLFWEFVCKSETPEGFPPVGSEQKPHSLSFQFCPLCSLPSLSVGFSWPGSKFMVLTLFHVYESQYICKWNLTPCFARKNSFVSFREKSLFLFRRMGVDMVWWGWGRERESLWMNQNRNSKRFWSFGRKEENNKTLMYYFLSVMSAEKLGSGPRNFTLSPGVCFSSGGVGFSFDGSFPFLLSHSKLH